MCTHTYKVYNKYIHKFVRVKCGHCSACLQEKANRRANKIRFNLKDGEICLFVTLTYDNKFVPYFTLDDVDIKTNSVKIKRDYDIRFVRNGSDYNVTPKVIAGGVLDIVEYNDVYFDVSNFKKMTKKDGFAVCYYKDAQNFIKRLRINLLRLYGNNSKFKFYCCSEYGETTLRCHFHLLIFIDRASEQQFRDSIVRSWPYADSRITKRGIEIARSAASYVASYVNCRSYLPAFFQKTSEFSPCFSHSKGFGSSLRVLSLGSLMQKVHSRDLHLTLPKKQVSDGSAIRTIPFPQFVINRYFPQFKGYSRIPPAALLDVLQKPETIRQYKRYLDLSEEDIYKISVRLGHAIVYYGNYYGYKDFKSAALAWSFRYVETWNLFKCQAIKDALTSVKEERDWLDFYDNNEDVIYHPSLFQSFIKVCKDVSRLEENPNRFRHRVALSSRYSELYRKCDKSRKVTNTILSKFRDDI